MHRLVLILALITAAFIFGIVSATVLEAESAKNQGLTTDNPTHHHLEQRQKQKKPTKKPDINRIVKADVRIITKDLSTVVLIYKMISKANPCLRDCFTKFPQGLNLSNSASIQVFCNDSVGLLKACKKKCPKSPLLNSLFKSCNGTANSTKVATVKSMGTTTRLSSTTHAAESKAESS
ncbi:hypothetical protein BDR26DRAFT_859931 [Obelidium mucronatum]|nr:hypothetical protein BDR26DRAFT_859931 [Obelidium mucronatum]